MRHHLRLQRPKKLGVVVCEMSLDRFEQLLVGATRELRPALALDDTSLPLVDRVHFVIVAVDLAAPRRESLVRGSDPTVGTFLEPRWRYVSGTFPRPELRVRNSD